MRRIENADLENLRELSWDDTEPTVKLGEGGKISKAVGK